MPNSKNPPRKNKPDSPKSSTKGTANAGEVASMESDMLSATKFTEALQALKEDICGKIDSKVDFLSNSLRNEISAVKEEFQNSLSGLQATVGTHASTIQELETFASTHSDTVASLESKLEALSAEVCALKKKCDDLEGRQRRHNLRILGIPEGDEGSTRPTQFIAQILQEMLGLEEPPLLDRAHRTPREKPRKIGNVTPRPRAFVLRVHYFDVRDQILRLASEASPPLQRDGNRVSIFPDFTAEVARKRAAFNPVKKILHEHPSIKFGVFFPAELKITLETGEVHKFTNPDKAMAFVTTTVSGTVE